MIKRISYIVILLVVQINSAYALTKIDINKGNIDPIPLALSSFKAQSSIELHIAQQIERVIMSDLESTGLIRLITKNSFLETINDINTIPNFPLWQRISASALAVGTIHFDGQNLEAKFKLWDNFTGKQLTAKVYNSSKDGWRKLAHIIADEIYSRLTGEYGYFNSKITYVAETGPGVHRVRRLAIMDQDGANHRFLTAGENLVLMPTFSPDGTKILYLSYAHNKPQVYLKDLITSRERIVGNFPGMSFAPRFSPDGQKAAMSVAHRGASNVYLLDLQNIKQTKLTSGSSIDTSPSFSPDGKKIVFTSDRTGTPKLYTMNVDGSNITQISSGQGSYTTPTWSPREDLIAFTRQWNGRFYIGVIRPDGSGERLLTEGYLVEGPSWAPNGRVIIYTRGAPSRSNQVGGSKLYTIDITGFNERVLPTPVDASDPSWSNLMK